MEMKTICLYQWIRQKKNIKIEGAGDCMVCKANHKNKYCKKYIKININIIDIKNVDKR